MAVQLAIVATASLAFWLARGGEAAWAAAYGGAAALLSAWMLGRRVRLAAETARSEPGRETAVLYIGAVQRFLIVLVLFAVGMGQLGLPPVPLLAGFGLAQLAFFVLGPRARPRVGETKTLERWG
jgi:ATP synthase protein I